MLEIGTTGGAAAGAITVDAGNTLTATTTAALYGNVVDNGTISESGGTLTVSGALSGSGQVLVGANATLAAGALSGSVSVQLGADATFDLNGTAAAGDTIAFTGNAATLTIGAASTYNFSTNSYTYTPYAVSAELSGFAIGDGIIVDDTTLTNAVYSSTGANTGTLALFAGSTAVETLSLAGNYTGQTFLIAPTTNSSSAVILVAPTTGGTSPVSTGTDAYEWIGSSGGSWGSAADWEDLTSGADPATAVPGSGDPVTIAGPTGAIYEVISGGGNSASLSVTGLVDLSGAYGTGGLSVGSVSGAPGTATFTSGGLTLGPASAVTATTVNLIDGSLTVSGSGAGLTASGAVTVGAPGGDNLSIAGQTYGSSNGASGSITLGAGATLSAAGLTVADGSVSASGSGTSLTVNGALSLGIAPSTSFVAGMPYYDGGEGSLSVTSGASVSVTGAITENYLSSIGVSGAGSSLTAGGTLTLGSSFGDYSLSVQSGGTVQVGGLLLNNTSTVGSAPSIEVDSTSVLEIGTTGGAAAGAITVDAGNTLTATTTAALYGNVVDNGTISESGGTLTVSGALSGSGQVLVGANATLAAGALSGSVSVQLGADATFDLNGTAAAGDTIAFTGNAATLTIGAASTYNFSTNSYTYTPYAVSAELSGFATGDGIIVDDTTLTNAVYSSTGANTGTLALFAGSTAVETLSLAGNYTGQTFLIAPTTNSASAVTLLSRPGTTVPTSEAVLVGTTTPLTGFSVTDTNAMATGITITLTDTTGELSATDADGGTVTGAGTDDLVISGSLTQANADLATLTYLSDTPGTDTINLDAVDLLGSTALQAAVPVTVVPVAPPLITVPVNPVVVQQGATTPISPVTITDPLAAIAGETVTVMVGDTVGLLSANTTAPGGGGTITSSGTMSLTVTGTPTAVDADLTTLAYLSSTPGSDTVTVTASGTYGGAGTPATFTVLTSGPPVISAPASATVGLNQATPISGVSISELPSITGETFTVTLTDANGVLSAETGAPGGGGTITPSNGGTTLTIAGTLAQVNADLTTLTDDDPTAGSDPITVNASDSFGNNPNPQTIAVTVQAPTLTTLVSFNGTNGQYPDIADLITDAAGDLFGTTFDGGVNNVGTVFEITKTGGGYASTPTTLVSFNGSNGANPVSGLIADAAGDLFGTVNGGTNNQGTVFEIPYTNGSYAGTPITLVEFNGSDGADPFGNLIADAGRDLFGTTLEGGPSGDGTVFEIAKTAGGYVSTPTTLASFNGANGAYPWVGLIADAAGDLFGVTAGVNAIGGTNGDGTVFELVNAGGGNYTLTTLVTFSGINGANPVGNLIADAAGDLFGTTDKGGANGDGTVFELVNAGGGNYTLTTLVTFSGINGANPIGDLIADAAGDLFGTTSQGGANGDGTVFEIGKTGTGYASTPSTLVSFDGPNGAQPLDGLIADAAGDLFGDTDRGGANTAGSSNGTGDGTVFELSGTGFQVPVVLAITAPTSVAVGVSQTDPINGISLAESGSTSAATFTVTLADTKGVLTANTGATGGGGTITPSNGGTTLTIAGSLAQVNADLTTLTDNDPTFGSDMITVNASDNLGGMANPALIAVTVNVPTLTTLASFNGSDGEGLYDSLIADGAGDLFGTTYGGGANNDGTVFEIAKGGGSYATTPTVLANLSSTSGINPFAGLFADPAGDLFGITQQGGANTAGSYLGLGFGTVFEIAKTSIGYASTPTTVVSFNGANGAYPDNNLIADAAGDLFGTSSEAGLGGGNVFEIAKTSTGYASTPTTLINFNGTNGYYPASSLIADAAGDLFGTTRQGGANSDGTVFEIANNAGSYTLNTLVSFNGANGKGPFAGLIADAVGDLFGTTASGGTYGDGTVFELVNNGGGSYTQNTLASFNGTDGEQPYFGGLIADTAGDLFGTTVLGGANGDGTVFEIAKTGGSYASMPTTLVSFDGANGSQPYAALIADAAGDLFGTTSAGGANGDGTVFELSGTGFQVPIPSSPVITAPGSATVGLNQATPISGVSLAESGNTAGETFTVTVADSAGLLSASGTGVSGSGTTSLTITGSLSQVNTDLATLTDTDDIILPDTIAVSTSDSFGNTAAQQQIAVTVNGPPQINAPSTLISVQGTPSALSVSVAEPGNVSGETFTVAVSDSNGLLSALGSTVTGSGSTNLSITGSLTDENTALGTLTDTDPSTVPDQITLQVSDSLGNVASMSVSVTVAPLSPQFTAPSSVTLPAGVATSLGVSLAEPDDFMGNSVTATITDTYGTLSASGVSGASVVSSSGGHSLLITGSSQQVNAALATLVDNASAGQPDTVNVSVADGLGNAASTSINVTSGAASSSTVLTPLFAAILAMDAYNRGYGQGVFGLSDAATTAIGNATITLSDGGSAAQAIGFYALAYSWNGTTVISFRGTDNSLITESDNDILNGWLGGAGILTTQAVEAANFYALVTGKSITAGRANNVLLTGHSLGGGLAGYLAALTGDSAQIFDSMPYAGAAFLTFLSENAAAGITNLASLFTGGGTLPFAPFPNATNITSEYTSGEILAPVRFLAPTGAYFVAYEGYGGLLVAVPAALAAVALPLSANNLPPLNAYQGSLAGFTSFNPISLAIDLHSIPLLVLLKYAQDQGLTAWQTFGPELFPAYFNQGIASALGRQQGPTGTGMADPAGQMLTMIAYSAINSGYMPYGDTGIQSLFHDGDALGEFYSSSYVPNALSVAGAPNIAADLAGIAVEYAGFLAETANTSNTTGVIYYDQSNQYLEVNLSTDTWTSTNVAVNTVNEILNPNIVDEPDLIGSIFSTTQFATDEDIDNLVLGTDDPNAHTIDLSADTGTDLVYAGNGTVTIIAGSGEADILAGTGTDTVIAGSGTTDFLAGAGTDTVNVNQPGEALDFTGSSGGSTINASGLTTDEFIDVLPGTGDITAIMGPKETLGLENANSFIGSISGFLLGNVIDLVDISATAAVLGAGDALSVEFDVGTFPLQLSGGSYSGDLFETMPDLFGGTDIIVATLTIAPVDPIISGNAGSEDFTITRYGDTSAAETVYVSTTDGTTVDGESINSGDFTPLSFEPVTFAAGDADTTVSVTIVGDDTSPGSKTFGLQVTEGTSAAANILATDEFTLLPPLIINAPATAAVAQNEATPIPGISLSESGNTSSETFTITLSDDDGIFRPVDRPTFRAQAARI